ncbi:sensor histidine kinase [Paenibacillus lutrae]|uniref:Sensor histidine kinase n=1 Tax=Paenibacillus lutrae TaxID=2078573 RepID=A0A7X3FM68_9BACL|nr:sensor histidine kinase [Paenibacillus lutrae]MVP01817.1 HAMP domain-containing protein [Paenibacillus lutrae]
MESYKKRLTNMIWRSMAESIVLCLAVLSFVIYLLYSAKFIVPIASWGEGLRIGSMLIGGAIVLGAAYGYWNSNRTTRRLELLMETMQLLEIGSLSRSTLPPLGEDEIGRLGEQLGRVVKKWEEQVASLQRLSNNNAQLAEKARVSAIIEERQRLARELHDAVSQQLFAISMTATAALRTLDKDFERAQRQIHLIEEMSSVAQSEMRALLLHLRPVHLEGKQLSEGLNRLLEELKAKVPMEIMWEVDENITLTKGIEDHLFRIVQEAMSNALRHSKATKLELRMQQKAGWLRLLFRDNGVGFDLDEEKQTSYGISTMRERVNEIGGSLQLVTAPGSGTRIEIRVPIIMEGDNK